MLLHGQQVFPNHLEYAFAAHHLGQAATVPAFYAAQIMRAEMVPSVVLSFVQHRYVICIVLFGRHHARKPNFTNVLTCL